MVAVHSIAFPVSRPCHSAWSVGSVVQTTCCTSSSRAKQLAFTLQPAFSGCTKDVNTDVFDQRSDESVSNDRQGRPAMGLARNLVKDDKTVLVSL